MSNTPTRRSLIDPATAALILAPFALGAIAVEGGCSSDETVITATGSGGAGGGVMAIMAQGGAGGAGGKGA